MPDGHIGRLAIAKAGGIFPREDAIVAVIGNVEDGRRDRSIESYGLRGVEFAAFDQIGIGIRYGQGRGADCARRDSIKGDLRVGGSRAENQQTEKEDIRASHRFSKKMGHGLRLIRTEDLARLLSLR